MYLAAVNGAVPTTPRRDDLTPTEEDNGVPEKALEPRWDLEWAREQAR